MHGKQRNGVFLQLSSSYRYDLLSQAVLDSKVQVVWPYRPLSERSSSRQPAYSPLSTESEATQNMKTNQRVHSVLVDAQEEKQLKTRAIICRCYRVIQGAVNTFI